MGIGRPRTPSDRERPRGGSRNRTRNYDFGVDDRTSFVMPCCGRLRSIASERLTDWARVVCRCNATWYVRRDERRVDGAVRMRRTSVRPRD